jgi:Cu-Zn family superoxide dismutase
VHAIHIHEVGKCEASFKSAGGHFNPGGHEHGMKNAKGMHAGDLPNIEVLEDGTPLCQGSCRLAGGIRAKAST